MSNLYRKKPLAMLIALAGTTFASSYATSFELEEVIVTAQKRAQTLQETPVAVSVTGLESIEQTAIQDLNDLQGLVPSLRVNQINTSAGVDFKIRGFGNGSTQPGIEPSVGVFIDGVFRNRSASAIQDLLNIERVEVLRGPQTTLFGKNASAGVVSVVTKRPGNEHEAKVETTIDNYNARIVKGYWSGPVIEDVLALGVSGSMNKRDGYAEYVDAAGNKIGENNERDRWNLRTDLAWTPNDELSLRLTMDYGEIDEICCNSDIAEIGPVGLAAIGGLGGSTVADPFDYKAPAGTFTQNDITEQGVSLEVEWDLEAFTLTSVTAQRQTEVWTLSDGDTNVTDIAGDVIMDREYDTFTQEIRLTSNGDGSVDWLAGVFYLDETLKNTLPRFGYGTQTRDYFAPLIAGVLENPAVFGLPAGSTFTADQGLAMEAEQEGESLTFFGQVDIHVTESVTLTAGINYTQDEKEVEYFGDSNDVLTPFGLSPFAPQVALPNAVESGKSEDDKLTWLARVSWDVNENLSTYLSAATGFKATSWDLHINSAPAAADAQAIIDAGIAPLGFSATNGTGSRKSEPEEVLVFELGIKGQWDNLIVNAAIFDQTFENFQSNTFTGSGFILGNAKEQSVTGVEIETTWYPVEQLQLSLAATWLDATYDEYEGGPSRDGGSADLSGETPSGIPEWSAVATAVYSHAFENGMEGYVRADYIYENEHTIRDNMPARFTREVGTFNASVGVDLGEGWSAQLWGRNLNNDKYLVDAFPVILQTDTFGGYPNPPRSYGLTVRKEFF